ncbi:uncharacterized protein E0L32_005692 [Thyridium curvatum]|uniref:AN1-type domain-containing protein n=1 Tax=Thyridium curvatum TaxID=1093900 RepID=A0A507AVJ3_9PEZI|nr:uncharacterized protein E0L32_005692 [Thyridium curvatum]TPX13992.1 hypothetical protein E0L32_005692 [Thyridium curvatum]
MAPKKIKCNFKDCRDAAQRIVGDCAFCNQRFCGRHRLLEDHKCSGLEDVSIPDTPWWLVGLAGELSGDEDLFHEADMMLTGSAAAPPPTTPPPMPQLPRHPAYHCHCHPDEAIRGRCADHLRDAVADDDELYERDAAGHRRLDGDSFDFDDSPGPPLIGQNKPPYHLPKHTFDSPSRERASVPFTRLGRIWDIVLIFPALSDVIYHCFFGKAFEDWVLFVFRSSPRRDLVF